MVYEVRAPLNYVSGVLSTAIAVSDTSVSAAAFASLPTNLSTSNYLPLVLHDPSAGTYEVVWVTAHSGTSTTVTAVRAREGSTARAWPSGTRVICAPTTRDVMPAGTRASLPSDAHLGMRQLLTDESVVVEQTINGWLPSAGMANPSQLGPQGFNLSAFPPAGSIAAVRAGAATGTLDANGQATISYRSAFPTATIAVIPVSRFTGSEGPIVVLSAGASSFSFAIWRPSTGARAANAAYTVMYIAIGY